MGQAGGHNDGTAEHYSSSPFIQSQGQMQDSIYLFIGHSKGFHF